MDQIFPPLRNDHPAVGRVCPVCVIPFVPGDRTTLVAPVPAGPRDSRRAWEGRAYTAEYQLVHDRCATADIYLSNQN